MDPPVDDNPALTIRSLISTAAVRWALCLLTLFAATAAAVAARYGLGWIDPLQTADGTYQTFGMLDRLMRGELPGLDYIPYLGIGLNYVLALPYAALGANIFAAFAAGQLGTTASWLLICWLLCWIAGFQRRDALTVAMLLFVVGAVLDLSFSTLSPGYRSGHSLLLLRECAVLPGIAAIVLIPDERRRMLVLAMLAGIMVFWSPSAGIGQLAASLITVLIVTIGRHGWRGLLPMAALGGLAILAALATATLLSLGDPAQLLRRVFLVTGNSQFWFFGGFGPTDRVLTVADFRWAVAPNSDYALRLLIALAGFGIALRRHGALTRRGQAAILVLLAWSISGLGSSYAGHASVRYLTPLYAAGTVLLAAMAVHRWYGRPIAVTGRWTFPVASAAACLVAAAAAYLIAAGVGPGGRRPAAGGPGHIAALGLTLPVEANRELRFVQSVRTDLDLRKLPADRRIFSTYYAWPDVLLGASPRPAFNSIIHVLGQEDQRKYLSDFRAAATPWAATLDPAWTGYDLWSVRASWFFYRELVAHYRPVFRGNAATYWRRRSVPAPMVTTPFDCHIDRIDHRRTDIRIAGPSPSALLDVAISYDAATGTPNFRGDLGRGYLHVDDHASRLRERLERHRERRLVIQRDNAGRPSVEYGLPAGRHGRLLPVEHRQGQDSIVSFEVRGSANRSLTIHSCRVLRAFENPLADLERLPRPGDIRPL